MSDVRSEILLVLSQVNDPEIPVLSVLDLGIIREIDVEGKTISITPTYSGCPAMKVFEDDIKTALTEHGFSSFQIKTVISPAWTTDWISQEGRIKLEKYGIAPPLGTSADKQVLFGETKLIPCPQCKSKNTKMISQFGSTACKALYRCEDCLEPFDYFKCL
ncbi:MAG: phenylacetate-CoA oxygenase subunit PaaJ [Flavobacteriales bacterium]|nr:phenylacetate-CoA oxygenase subunit PaaJ [Flavobacteriales bacterium]